VAGLRDLGRNLLAGARLALFRPLEGEAFARNLVAWLLLVAFSALLDVALDWLRASPQASFAFTGLDGELYAVGLLMVSAGIVAAACRDAAAFVALPITVLASFPLLQIVHAAPDVFELTMSERGSVAFDALMLAWMLAVCSRAVYVVCDAPQRRVLRAVLGGLLLTAPLWFGPLLGPDTPWWEEPEESEGETTSAGTTLSPVSEAVMAAQGYLLDQALEDLEDQRPGVTDLYFIGFAPDARAAGFRAEVEELQRSLDTGFGTRGRSVALVNSPDTLAELPFATVTNLRRVLLEIGSAIDRDEDVVMLYLTAADTGDHGLLADHPPLDLLPLTPDGLAQLLEAADIRYRVIVVSTCAAGAWADALADDDTLVVVSAPGNARPAGCAGGPQPSAFANALDSALRGNVGLGDALRTVAAGTGARIAGGAHVERQLERLGRQPGIYTAALRHRVAARAAALGRAAARQRAANAHPMWTHPRSSRSRA
jgi:hypothetical protein